MEFTNTQKTAITDMAKAMYTFSVALSTFAGNEVTKDIEPAPKAKAEKSKPKFTATEIQDMDIIALKKLADDMEITYTKTTKKPALVEAILDGLDLDATVGDGMTLEELTQILHDFTDEDLTEMLTDNGLKAKGNHKALLKAVCDGVNADKIDLNDYVANDEDEDEDDTDDDEADAKSEIDYDEILREYSDKEIRELLTSEDVEFSKKAKRPELIKAFKEAVDNGDIDLDEYEFDTEDDE